MRSFVSYEHPREAREPVPLRRLQPRQRCVLWCAQPAVREKQPLVLLTHTCCPPVHIATPCLCRSVLAHTAHTHARTYTTPHTFPGCFACGTQVGFRIYNCEPFRETFRRDFPSGGIGSVEMLFRCNLLALVGGGRPPCWPETKVMVWDDHQNRCIGELNFRAKVIAVKMRRDRIVVVLATKVYLYNFSDLKVSLFFNSIILLNTSLL